LLRIAPKNKIHPKLLFQMKRSPSSAGHLPAGIGTVKPLPSFIGPVPMVLVMGEMSYGGGALDIAGIARRTLCEIGYDNAESGFDGNTCAVLSVVHGQSSDIAMGVDSALEQRSGEADAMFATGADQGMMFGFACRETERPDAYAD